MKEYNRDFIQLNDKKKKSEKKNLALYLATHISFYIILIFFAIFFTWYTVFVTTHGFYEVHGPSMMPTLNTQIKNDRADSAKDECYDAVYIDRSTGPKAFDIIVLQTNEEIWDSENLRWKTVNTNAIKRFMAGEGDFISVAFDANDVVHFYRIPNGEAPTTFKGAMLIEDGSENGYNIKGRAKGEVVDKDDEWSTHLKEINERKKIGDFHYTSNFVSNYLKLSSSDIEQIEAGTFEREDIFISSEGLVYVKVPQGKFFYLGDNRSNSKDSMMAEGFEDTSKIVGRGEIVVKNYNFANRLWEVIKFYFSEVEKFFAK